MCLYLSPSVCMALVQIHHNIYILKLIVMSKLQLTHQRMMKSQYPLLRTRCVSVCLCVDVHYLSTMHQMKNKYFLNRKVCALPSYVLCSLGESIQQHEAGGGWWAGGALEPYLGM